LEQGGAMTGPEPAEAEGGARSPNVRVVGDATVSGQLSLDVLVRQLDHANAMNNELRGLLREERWVVASRDASVDHLGRHVKALEASVQAVTELSERRHAEIERLGHELERALAALRSIEQSRLYRLQHRYHAARRLLWRLRRRLAG
jgi:hypothetical protein